jgi:hypothetical protein
VEFKSYGRQVVAPGSLHPDKPGLYTPHDTYLGEYGAPPPAPKALVEAAKRKKIERREATAGAYTAEQIAAILDALHVEEFDSNDTWFPILCAAHHATGGDDEALEHVVEWSTAHGPYRDQESIIRMRWYSLDSQKGEAITINSLFKELHERGRGDVVELVTRSRAEDDFEPVSPEDVLRFAVLEEKPSQRRRFVEYGLDDLAKVDAPRWLVDELVPENGLALVYGRPKAGKTFWAFALSLSIATGRDFCGRKTLPGRVSYIAAEGGPARLRDRARAWLKQNGIDQAEARDWRLFAERVDVSDAKEVEKLIAALGPDPRRRLVVVDTLARSMSGDENTQHDMGRLIAGCDRIRQATGATVLLVHHEGKDPSSGARGSSALKGAIDTGLHLRSTGGKGVVLTVEDQRDGERAADMHFVLANVPLSGIEDSSAALVHIEAAEADERDEVLGLAAELGDGTPQAELVEELGERRKLPEATARRRVRAAIREGRERATTFDGKAVWLERVDKGNTRSGKVVRVEAA